MEINGYVAKLNIIKYGQNNNLISVYNLEDITHNLIMVPKKKMEL